MIHARRTDPRLGEWLDDWPHSPLAADRHTDTGATIRQLKRQYDKRVKLPQSLVEELAAHGGARPASLGARPGPTTISPPSGRCWKKRFG